MKEFLVRLGWFYYRKKWIFSLVYVFLLVFAFMFYKATKLYSISAYPLYAFLMFEIFCSWLASPVRNYKVADIKAKEALQVLAFIGKYEVRFEKLIAMRDESNATHNSKKLGKWLNKFHKSLKLKNKVFDAKHKRKPNMKRLIRLNTKLINLQTELFDLPRSK